MYRKDISMTLSFLQNLLETAVRPNPSLGFILGVQHGSPLGSLCNYPYDLIRSPACTNTYVYFHIVLRQEEQGMNKTGLVPWVSVVRSIPNV